MFAIILILAVSMLICPLIDLIHQPAPADSYARRARFGKILVIAIALLYLLIILFFPANSAVLLPHPHGPYSQNRSIRPQPYSVPDADGHWTRI